ncbi:MAG TPA: multicopper oxidase domain-containing protein [Gemmatimonadales bacterium]|nr:multicopper oxidase domain-containing protein [Gemmatimonadales bacterium]
MTRPALASLAFVLLAVSPAPPSPDIELNDNLHPAGRMVGGVLVLDLEIRPGSWHPLGSGKPSIRIPAFAEAGKPLQNPGPMIRVRLGTPVRARVTNRSDSTLIVRGLSSRRILAMDSMLLAPGASATASFTADAEGSFYYWAGRPGEGLVGLLRNRRWYEESQLNGAFIVDPAAGTPLRKDRVLVLGLWTGSRDSAGLPEFNNQIYVINGRPWPHTERMTYAMGDSVRWRVINTSPDVHPLHLHGFYFRVDARGDMARDTIYWAAERRMAVTERLLPGATMAMAWTPDRPGGWVFHCHLTFHVVSNPGLGADRLDAAARRREIRGGHPDHDPENHVEKAMGGLMMGLYVRPAPGWTPDTRPPRTIRLFVNTDSTAADTVRRFGYVAQEGESEPRPDSITALGSTLVLHRGEPTAIWVINRALEPTAIHWHGMELESPFDGVVGVGGYPGSPTPTIMPGDSFLVRMTPPRAGTFMYHTHVNDVRQLKGGLWAPLLVLEPGESYDPSTDLVFILGEAARGAPVLNGRREHSPMSLKSGQRYRLRLLNVTAATPNLQYWLAGSGPTFLWRPLARDGYDLPVHQRGLRRAEEFVAMGQIADFEFVAPPTGPLALELRNGAGLLLTKQPFTVARP